MTDKWTVGSNNEGLYNGVNPSCKGEEKEREKERKKRSRDNYCNIERT